MPEVTMKAHDLLPSVQAILKFDDDTLAPLADAESVHFIMQVSNASRPADVNAPCVIVDAAQAIVRYDWVAGDTDIPGAYRAEFEVHYPGGKPQTHPTDSYIEITILADLDVGGV